jgi:glucose/arabinose dehydrogenase/PKD repeat protein
MVAAPGPLNAVDPTPAPPAGPEMFRQPEGAAGASPRAPFPTPVVGPGFHDSAIFSGLFQPTAIAFAPDGRVFVAEKRGIVDVYDSISDPTPTEFADLTDNVHDYWDRGLLGLALDPGFATNGRVYVVYTYNHVLGDPDPSPKWVDEDGFDECPKPPGATTDGCVVSARLSRLEPVAPGGAWDHVEHVLVEDWCQVHPSHSIGTVAFGPDGALYAGGGDGASFVSAADYGQDFGPADDTTPDNPCGDPPSPVGTALSPPSAQGGDLRSQDLRTPADPVTLSGTIIRVDPATGDAWPANANIGDVDPNARRIIAYGLRNPFRFAFRPDSNEVWIGDVGAETWEEFDRVVAADDQPRNFGWPCYEGAGKKPSFDSLNLTICENLYDAADARGPYYTYNHSSRVVPGDPCPTSRIGGSVIAGTAFYPTSGGPFPAAYDGALFFADYARNCIWAMRAGTSGLPDSSQIETFASSLSGPVDLKIGPDGALYYVGFDDDLVHRITVGPTAVVTADPTSGPAPLHVHFDGSESSDPKLGLMTFAWDLDGDGAFDDSTDQAPDWDYVQPGVIVARLRVTDSEGTADIASVTISAGNNEPIATIAKPSSSRTWSVGDTITFAGSATDAEDGAVPAGRLTWTVFIQHCPAACHSHTIKTVHGAGGIVVAPNHGFPSSLEIRLVATDSAGAQSPPVSVFLQPKTVDLSFVSDPPGVLLTVGEETAMTPFTATVINKSVVEVSAPAAAMIDGLPYGFAGWSDGKGSVHSLKASASTPALVATYAPGTSYVPIAPVRVADTRTSPAGRLRAGVARTFEVAGTHGIPAEAVAVTGNLTAVEPTKAGWIGLSSGTGLTPTTSVVNLPAGDIRANGVTMLLDDQGRLKATFNAASGSTHAILDITGYFLAANSGATFTPLGPIRVLDSRTGIGGVSHPFVSGRPRSLQLAGNNGIPTDAVAVTGNLTITGQTARGYVAMTTGSTATPAVSTINAPVGDTRANGLTVKLNGAGRASLVYVGGVSGVATADLIFDVTGYYRPGTAGLRFYPIEPRRIFDTRTGNSPSLRAGISRSVEVVDAATIADDAVAVATNVTVVGQTAAGFVAVTTNATTTPTTSTINIPLGDVRANNTLNALNGAGSLRAIYIAIAGARAHLIVDLQGYFR